MEWRVQCSVVYSTVLSFPPLLGIIQSMNISLITAEKAQQCQAEDACHTPPSALITAPTIHTSPSLLFPFPPFFSSSAYLILLPFCFLSSPLFSFSTSFTLSCLHSFSMSLCHLFLFLHPPTPNLFLWMERNFLFTTRITVPALLTNQQGGISTRDEPGMLVF